MSEHTGVSRRGVVRAAAGAFTLAASGLVLPAAARAGALDGELGGRHGQNSRGQERRHDAGDRKRKRSKKDNKTPPPGRGLLKNIQVRVLNLSGNPFSFVLISDFVRISGDLPAHQWLDETDLKDDQGWIWMQTCECQVAGWPLGVAVHINNPPFAGVWYQVWADMALSRDGLYKDQATWSLTNPTTIAEREEVVVPWPRPWEGAWNLRLRRFDDSQQFKRFELEFDGIRPPFN